MTTTISVEDKTLERFRDLKAELDDRQDGAPDHTADSFMWALMDTWEAADEGCYSSDDTLVDADEIADAVAKRDVTLEASERRRIAQEVAEALR